MKFVRIIKAKEDNIIDLYTENLNQPIKCEVVLDEYGNGKGKYISGFNVGDTIHVRMLGMRNFNVYNFEITEVNSDNIVALHPRGKNEYIISLKKPIEVSHGDELRFEPVDDESRKYWFAFLYLNK